ncbi:uncharacterized protein DNG_04293 [Cephalotrichum gorgonifer]|uniref:Carrier domain-containing protein n=1 Tax=Cephalotrichum gorgonifer TaxID=2041049 RepID=A0AAE8SUE5_9PEZI|nr:uncharacterized protein DNG_04293 [Cephalotrichum gorgonifer]
MPKDQTTEGRPPMEMQVADLDDIEDLHCFSKAHGVTIANIFQLAWALVLSKYTCSEVCFGHITSTRSVDVVGTNPIVDAPVNTMVTRITLSEATPIEKALQMVQSDSLDAFSHQIPLSDILATLDLGGGVCSTHHYPTAILIPDGRRTLAVKSFVKNPEKTLGNMQIITQEDLLQFHEWNNQVPKQDTDKCTQEVVSSQTLARPDAMADCAWDGNLSYEELEDSADRLAYHLVTSLGVDVGCNKVALCLNRSRWVIISQLAVLKAGGVVVSVDPKHPLQRLEAILKDISANLILTTHEYSSRFRDIVAHVVEVKVSSKKFARPPGRLQIPHQDVKSTAFLIYTSGSTGTPKGVVLTHVSLMANFLSHGKAFGMSPVTRSIQFASYTFIVSISDIWATLVHGGCVCVILEDEIMNDLEGTIRSYRGTLSQVTPTVASLLDLSKLPSLRTLVLGGEAVKPSMIEEFVKEAAVNVLNGYGLSEFVVGILTTDEGAVLAAVIEAGVSQTPALDTAARTQLLPMQEDQRQAFRALRKALGDVLPSHIIPHLYLPVARLPLSQSGKLFRKAIWEDLQQSPLLSSYLLVDLAKTPPSTDAERYLRDMWASTLNLPPSEVGANDEFFALGGDSLSAMPMVAKARRSSNTLLNSLTFADIFRHRVLSKLAAVVAVERTTSGKVTAATEEYRPFFALGDISIQGIQQAIAPMPAFPEVIVNVVPTTDLQAGCGLASLHKSRHSLGHISLSGTGPCAIDRWRESCLKLVQAHEILRTAYVFHQGQLLQVVLESFCPVIPHYEVASKQEIEQFTRDLMMRDMYNPPRLGRPFMEFAIITSSTCSHHQILFRLSHGEYDAIGFSYLINTLRSIHEGQPVPEYHTFASYVGSLLQGKTESLGYWRTILDGYSMPMSSNFLAFHTRLSGTVRYSGGA